MRIYAPLNRIRDNRFQRRSVYAEIEDLAHSIQQRLHTHRPTLGLLQTPKGRLVDGEGRPVSFGQFSAGELQAANFLETSGLLVELSIGHRRKRAFDWLAEQGDAAYAAAVLPVELADVDDMGQLDDVFEENYRRGNIAAADLAELITLKKQQLGAKATDADVAAAWKIGRSTVTKTRLLLERLPQFVLDANRDGRLSGEMAQRLIKVADIEAATKGRFKWSKDAAPQGWGHLMHPVAFLKWVIDRPDEASPAAVEKYIKDALRHAGRGIPDTVATFATEGDGIVQPKCKGCPLRVDGLCTDWGCLEAKKAAYGRKLAEDYAWEKGWLYSENPADFTENGTAGNGESLYKLFQGGGCQHMVIGWRGEGGAYRPNGYRYAHGDKVYEQGSTAGLILGHRGSLNGCAPTKAKARPGPSAEVLEAWEKRGKARVKCIEKEARQVLTGRVAAVGGEALRPLAALVSATAAGGDPVQMAAALVTLAWEKGKVATAYYPDPFRSYNALAEALAAAGVDVETLPGAADEQEALVERVQRVLCYYYDRVKPYGMTTEMAAAREALTAVDAEIRTTAKGWGGLPQELVDLWSAVGDALAEIGRSESTQN